MGETSGGPPNRWRAHYHIPCQKPAQRQCRCMPFHNHSQRFVCQLHRRRSYIESFHSIPFSQSPIRQRSSTVPVHSTCNWRPTKASASSIGRSHNFDLNGRSSKFSRPASRAIFSRPACIASHTWPPMLMASAPSVISALPSKVRFDK